MGDLLLIAQSTEAGMPIRPDAATAAADEELLML